MKRAGSRSRSLRPSFLFLCRSLIVVAAEERAPTSTWRNVKTFSFRNSQWMKSISLASFTLACSRPRDGRKRSRASIFCRPFQIFASQYYLRACNRLRSRAWKDLRHTSLTLLNNTRKQRSAWPTEWSRRTERLLDKIHNTKLPSYIIAD